MPHLRIILAASLALLGGACAAHPHRALGTRVGHDDARARFDSTLTGRCASLAVAPTLFASSRGRHLEEGEREYIIERELFDGMLLEMLRASGGFRSVEPAILEESSGGEVVSREGVLLQLELDSQSLRYVSGSANQGLVIAMWYLLLGLPAQWIHDETYALRFTGRGRITDGETGRVLQEVDLGECSAESSFNFLERTSSVGTWLLTLLLPPPAITPDEEALLKGLGPSALADAFGRLKPAFEEIDRGILAPPPEVQAELSPEGRVRILHPDAPEVAFAFRSPSEGDPLEGETVDLDLDLVFPEDASDLAQVTVNGEVVLRYEEGRPVPLEKRLPLRRRNVPLDNGKVTISVRLHSATTPVEAEILLSQVDGGE